MSSRNANRKRRKRGKFPPLGSDEFERRVDALVAEGKVGDVSTPIRACATAAALSPREVQRAKNRMQDVKDKREGNGPWFEWRSGIRNYYDTSHLDGVLVRPAPPEQDKEPPS